MRIEELEKAKKEIENVPVKPLYIVDPVVLNAVAVKDLSWQEIKTILKGGVKHGSN